nr:toxin regulator [Jeotgalibacillus sp. R-1-5s-1]
MKKWFLPSISMILFIAILIVLLNSLMSSSNELQARESSIEELETNIERQNGEIENYRQTIADYDEELASEKREILKQEREIEKLEKKLEEAAPWFELTEAERERKINEEKERKLAEEAEKVAAAEAERQKALEEERKGYETGITFEQLARTPDDFTGKKVKFYGKVVQVIEDGTFIQIRFAVNDDYDTILFAVFDSSMIDINGRVLEDDLLTIMGTSGGLFSYEATSGAEITIPLVYIDQILY